MHEQRAELRQLIEEYKGITDRFVRRHPFSSIDELKAILNGPTGAEFLPAQRTQQSVLNERYYPHLKRLYDTAGNDPKVTKEVGQKISDMGGFAAMEVPLTTVMASSLECDIIQLIQHSVPIISCPVLIVQKPYVAR